MNSANHIDYEIRPCKYVERRMIVSLLSRIQGITKHKYQYIGFGGLSFVDFKLFHRELQIDSMISIEAGPYSTQKLEFNKPFSCIKIIRGESTHVLSNIDLSKPCIIWLDYDETLEPYMFTDIELIFKNVPAGSIYIMTCNRQLKVNNATMEREQLIEKFKDLVPYGIEKTCCAPANSAKTIKKMLEKKYNDVLVHRQKSSGEIITFKQLINVVYKETNGANMYSFGGVICDHHLTTEIFTLNDFSFLSEEEAYKIDVPIMTNMEIMKLNKVLNIDKEEKKLIADGIMTEDMIDKYKKIYKYFPTFRDVRY